MQQGINTEEVKKYNASLREYKEKSTKLRAEMEFNEKELQRQCSELSTELGLSVTPDNIKTILDEKVAKINSTMAIGNEIINRIKQEEYSQSVGATQHQQAQVQAQVQAQEQAVPQIPKAPQGVVATPPIGDLGVFEGGVLPPLFANINNNNITI